MSLVILRPVSRAPVQRIADGDLLHLVDHTSHKLIMDGLLDEKSSLKTKLLNNRQFN